jgi:hypothetical protein
MTTSDPPRAWAGTGQSVRVDEFADRLPAFDPRTGDHLWIVSTTYRVDPAQWADPTHTPILDTENLLLVSPPGCWHCEQLYTPQLAKRRCRGHG